MKKNIFIISIFLVTMFFCGAEKVWAEEKTYYVDCSRTNNGVGTEASPWNNIGSVNDYNKIDRNAFQSGDNVYFKRGSECHNQQLVIDWSGTASNPVIIGAYGSGNKPIINGGYETFTTKSPAQWAALIHVNAQNYVNIQDFRIVNSNGIGVRFDKNSEGVGSTYCGAYRIDVYNCYNAGIQAAGDNTHHITIDDCTISMVGMGLYNGLETVGPHATGSNYADHVTVKNCTIFQTHSEGIGFYKGADFCVAEHNLLYEVQRLGVYIDAGQDNIVRYNLIYGTTNSSFNRGPSANGGAAMWVADEMLVTPRSARNIFYGNLVAYYTNGIQFGSKTGYISTGNKWYNNTILGCSTAVTVYTNEGSFSECEIRNNIFYQAGGTALYSGATNFSGISFDHNLWYGNTINNVPTSIYNFGVGGTDINEDPKINPRITNWRNLTAESITADDFKIQSDSPAKNAGANLGSPYNVDYFGTNRLSPQGNIWDIGAHEYVSPTIPIDTTPPSNPTGLSVS